MLPVFESALSIEEIEKNFEDVDIFENLIVALQEALLTENEQKKGEPCVSGVYF